MQTFAVGVRWRVLAHDSPTRFVGLRLSSNISGLTCVFPMAWPYGQASFSYHSQNNTVTARAMAEGKTSGHLA